MISEAEKKESLSKILKSQTFKNSQTYQNLLKYLVNAAIKNQAVKEYDIAIEIFGKDASYNPAEDPTVRVYISNLRKKLKKYYGDEGKHDKIRLEIPSGHYAVRFFHKKSPTSPSQFFSGKVFLYFIISILLIIIIAISIKKSEHDHFKQAGLFLKNKVWQSITKSKLPLLVVLGDDYFIYDTKNINYGIHRFHYINSDSDLNRLKARDKQFKNYQRTPYTFTPRISLLPLKRLLPLFCRKNNIRFQNSSKIKTADFLTNDIIFLGSFRNLYIMRQALSDFLKDIKLGVGTNQFTVKTGDSTKTFTLEGYPQIKHSDYCLFRKVPGPKGNTIILFVSFFESGMSSTANYMTDSKQLNKLEQIFKRRFGHVPQYFDCVFRISGLKRTALTIHLEYLSEINPQTLKIW